MASCRTLAFVASAIVAASLAGNSFGTCNPAQDATDDDLKAQADAILASLVERYRSLNTYSDTLTVEFDVELDEDNEMFGGMMPPQEVELSYEAPNKLAASGDQMEFICDGQTIWTHLPMFGQYTEREAGSMWADVLLGDSEDRMPFASPLQLVPHPVLMYLVHGDERAADYASELAVVESIEHVERNGKRATLIRGTAESAQYAMMADDPLPIELWIDEETGLLAKASLDLTKMYNAFASQMTDMQADDEDEDGEGDDMFGAMQMPTYKRFRTVYTLSNVQVNDELPASRFTFKPEDDAEKVDEFEFAGMGGGNQMVLMGETAPDFTLPTLDGDELSLSDLRGKVVLLDFWALWCAPCVQALPHIQKIADRFEGQDVVVLGVNRDPEGSEERIERLLEKREVTFGHVLDFDGEAAELFHVTGIPCTVLIDAQGAVQDIGVGFFPGKVDELSEKIEKLLAGEQLHTPEEFEEIRAEAEDGAAGGLANFGINRKAQRELEESIDAAMGDLPGRLERKALPRSMRSNPWRVQMLDVDGSGEMKAVVPYRRGLAIVDLHEQSSEQMTFNGLPRSANISSFTLSRIDGRTFWVISAARQSMFGAQGASLQLFDEDGEEVWSFAPDLPREYVVSFDQLASADLTSDGRPEYIVVMQAMKMGGGRQAMLPGAQSTQVLVLSGDGKLLARQSVGSYLYAMHIIDAPEGAECASKTIFCAGQDRAYWLEYDETTAELTLRE